MNNARRDKNLSFCEKIISKKFCKIFISKIWNKRQQNFTHQFHWKKHDDLEPKLRKKLKDVNSFNFLPSYVAKTLKPIILHCQTQATLVYCLS